MITVQHLCVAKGFGLALLVSALLTPIEQTHAATVTQIGIGDFSGSETVIDFSGVPNQNFITNQFSGSDVTFSGGLYSNTVDLWPFPNANGAVASNYPNGNPSINNTITADFSSTLNRVGFFTSMSPNGDRLAVELFKSDGGSFTSLGGLVFGPTVTTAVFAGLEVLSGFDRMVLTGQGVGKRQFLIDDLRIEAVPIPAALPLFGAALGVIGLLGWRKRRAAA